MKREGKQHGMVRTYRILPPSLNPRPDSRLVNSLISRPTAGLFTKVTSKPTNHSKFTGKCGQARCNECHMHPITKSKNKSKGTLKMRSSNNDVGFKILTWQVASGSSKPGLKLSGFSATEILNLMYDNDDDGHVDDYDYDHDHDHGYDFDEEEGYGDVEENVKIESYGNDDDDDDDMVEYCDVGIMIEHVEVSDDEGWYLVEDIMTY